MKSEYTPVVEHRPSIFAKSWRKSSSKGSSSKSLISYSESLKDIGSWTKCFCLCKQDREIKLNDTNCGGYFSWSWGGDRTDGYPMEKHLDAMFIDSAYKDIELPDIGMRLFKVKS